MSKKVLLLAGSPRKGGNSDLLCDAFIKGAGEAGHETEKIYVDDLKLGGCKACYACRNTGKCFQKDGMEEVLEKMIAADVIVLATPVYFYSLSGQLKTLIDRTLSGYAKIRDKDFYFIATAAMEEAQKAGAQVSLVNIREKNIGFCKACYGCRETGRCVQHDDFPAILDLAHETNAIVCTVPIYYNCMTAQMLTVINRLCCTFACRTYKLGPKKKVAFMLTCTGSEVEEMTRHVRNITTLPSIARTIEGEKIEVFTQCVSDGTCAANGEYLSRVRKIGGCAAED